MYSKVMIGTECYGRGTAEECAKIVAMHKNSKGAPGKPSAISQLTFRIEDVPGEYPSGEFKVALLYKTGG